MQYSAHFVLDAEAYKHSEALRYKGGKFALDGRLSGSPEPHDSNTTWQGGPRQILTCHFVVTAHPRARCGPLV